VPAERGRGDQVFGASLNLDGFLTVRATHVGKDSALARIMRLVEEAQTAKAPAQRLADQISQFFVPAVMLLAAATFAGWLLTGHAVADAVSAGVAVLVVACPCALGLATPAAIMAGSGRGAQNGVLIRNGESLERLRRVNAVALDKTGTITTGRPSVATVIPVPMRGSEPGLLLLAAQLERGSEHPLARAIVARRTEFEGPVLPPVEDFTAIPGGVVSGRVGGKHVLVGSPRLFALHGIDLDGLSAQAAEVAARGESLLPVAVDGRVAGLIGAADTIKSTSAEAVQALHGMGIEVIMLTGDNHAAAAAVAGAVGIDQVVAEALPEDKATEVQRLQASGKIVAVAGDGINDAPALAQADAGIAMGTGTDVAMATADVTLVEGDRRHLAMAIRLSRAMARVIRQNLFWAFLYNVILIPLAAFGIVSPILAAAAMAFSSVSVVANALRLRRIPLLPSKDSQPHLSSHLSPAR
jgi:Cu+-exporting ATPase